MNKEYKVTSKGWFYFCPIYLEQGWAENLAPTIIPRFQGTDWLLNLATEFQQAMNLVLSVFNPDAGGFLILETERFDKPKIITISIDDESNDI